MFDIGLVEMVILAVVALIVVGPRDLPRLMRSVSGVVRKARGMAQEFRSGIDDLAQEVEREIDPFKDERDEEGLTPDMSPEEITAHIMGNKDKADQAADAFDPTPTPDPEPEPEPKDPPTDKKEAGHD